jgi:hypothetical protein
MEKEYDFSQGNRGLVAPMPPARFALPFASTQIY